MYFKKLREDVEKNGKRDSSFLLNTFAFSLMVLAVMFAIEPYLGNAPKIEDVQRMDQRLVTVYPGEMKEIIHPKSGKPVMLVMYASWCGYCKLLMPTLVDMVRTHQLDGIEPVFISMDAQPRQLSKYLVYRGYDGAFTPYRLEQDMMHGTLGMFIDETGSNFRGTIPYVGFFSRDGKMLTDATGVVDRESLLDVAEKVQQF